MKIQINKVLSFIPLNQKGNSKIQILIINYRKHKIKKRGIR